MLNTIRKVYISLLILFITILIVIVIALWGNSSHIIADDEDIGPYIGGNACIELLHEKGYI